jgi:hypothetical protein
LECILNLVDPSFDPGNPDKYRLSILLRPDGFSFCVLDNRSYKFTAISDYRLIHATQAGKLRPEKLCDKYNDIFSTIELIKLPFKSMDVAFASPKLTLVPAGFLRNETMDSYFRFNHSLDATEELRSQLIAIGEMTAVFALPSCIKRVSDGWFAGINISCNAAVLIQHLLTANSHILTRQVFINVWAEYFDIIIIQGYKLLYFNTFRKQAAEDLVYYAIYVLEQMGFIPAEEEVTLMGDILSDSEEFKLLYQYIDILKFASLDGIAEFSPAFSEVPGHKYFTLFNLPFCE